VVKLFCNENGYFGGFYVSYLLFPQFVFLFYLHVCCIVSCIGVPRVLAIRQRLFPICGSSCTNHCLISSLLDSGCSHSVVIFVLTTV
jgi:hypothetical protein